MIYLTLELLWNKHVLYKFLFTVLKIEALVIYHFPILVLGRIFDRGGTPLLLIFLLVSMILVLTVKGIFVVSLEKNRGGEGVVLHPPSPGRALYINIQSGWGSHLKNILFASPANCFFWANNLQNLGCMVRISIYYMLLQTENYVKRKNVTNTSLQSKV